jgi:phage terminase large subunit
LSIPLNLPKPALLGGAQPKSHEQNSARKYLFPFRKTEAFPRESCQVQAFWRLSARGPGKSRALLEDALAACNFKPDGKGGSIYREDGRGLNAIILRTSLTDLEGSVISKFKESDWFRKEYVHYSDQKKLVTFPNGATLKFGYAANRTDLAQYLGQEYFAIYWDELGLIPNFNMWIDMAGSLRCPVKDVFCRMAGSANPGGPGHAWLKNLFVDAKPAPGMEAHQFKKEHYAYIPATYLDGPYANDKDYLENLLMQPKAVQRAWILGDWDMIAGAYFSNWSIVDFPGDDKNPPTKDMTFDPDWLEKMRQDWWQCWVSVDWGFQHHAALYWHTMDGKGNVFTFKELVVRKQGSKALATALIENSKGLNIEFIYLSPDTRAKHDYDSNSIKQQMDSILLQSSLPLTTIASDDRKAGWLLMYQLLDSGEWRIGKNCQEALAAIPTLMIATNQIEDVLKTDTIGDDVADALRYGIFSRLQGRSMKPKAVVRQETLDAVQDPNRKYMIDLRLQAEELKKKAQFSKIGRIPGWKERIANQRQRAARQFNDALKKVG